MSSTPDFRALLLIEMDERRARNPRYSQRSFARDLGVTSGFLSQLLRGKKSLSVTRGRALATALQWPRAKRELFLSTLASAAVAASGEPLFAEEVRRASARLRDFDEIGGARFSLMSDWYYYAILQLLRASDFGGSEAEIATRLGLDAQVVAEAVRRLRRLRLLRGRNGRLQRTAADTVTSGVPDAAVRQFHQRQLRRASQALERVPFDQREFLALTLLFDPARLAELKDKLFDKLLELNEFCGAGAQKAVFQINLHCFPLEVAHGPSES